MPFQPARMLMAGLIRPSAVACGLIAASAALLPGGLTSIALFSAAQAGPAIGQFEIKTVGAEPGETEWQSQNDISFGNPRRRLATDDDGELVADDNSITRQRHALEGEWGLTTFLKARIGIGFERERFDDPLTAADAYRYHELKFDEIGFETNWTLVPRKGDGLGLGFLVEYEIPVASGEAQALNFGPLIELARGPWVASFSPMLTRYFGGGSADEAGPGDKMDLGYAARIMYTHSEELALAVEAYGSIERIGNSGWRDEASYFFGDDNQHRVGPIVYWTIETGGKETGGKDDDAAEGAKDKDDHSKIETTLGLGAFFGLTDATPDTTLKFSVEVAY